MSLYKRLHEVQGGMPSPEIQAPELTAFATQYRVELDALPDSVSGYVAMSCSKDVKDQILIIEKHQTQDAPQLSSSEHDRNQDDFFVSKEHQLFVVADGMGGHHGGAEASKLVAHAFRKEYSPSVPDVTSLDEAKIRLHIAVATARKDVSNERNVQQSDMGSTLIAAQIVEDKLVWANAGDSVLMVYRNGSVIRVSTEQTVPGRGSRLTNCIDSEEGRADEYGVFDLEPGDRIVLASDGVVGDEPRAMTDAELETLLVGDNPGDVTQNLVKKSKKVDDTTAIVVDYKPVATPKTPATPKVVDPSLAARAKRAVAAAKSQPTPVVTTPPATALPTRTPKSPKTGAPASPATTPDYSHLPPPPNVVANPVAPEAPKTMAELEAELPSARASYANALVLNKIGNLSDKKFEAELADYQKLLDDIEVLGIEELKNVNGISDPDTLRDLANFSDDLKYDLLISLVVEGAREQLIQATVKRRKALAFGTHKKIDAAKALYDEWRDNQGARAAFIIRSVGDEAGKTPAEIDEYLKPLAAKFAIIDALNLQNDICDEAQDQSGARGRFVKWWGRQGGEKFFSKAGFVGNLKRGAVMAPIGAAVALPLGAVFGAGFAGVAAVGFTRSLVRSAATHKLNSSSDEISAVKHAANDFEVSNIQIDAAVREDEFFGTDVITDTVNARTKLIVRGNRKSFVGSVALGLAGGTIGGFAAGFLKDHIPFVGGSGGGSTNGGGTTPPTTEANGSGQGGVAVPGTGESTTTASPNNTSTTNTTRSTTTTTNRPSSTTTTARPTTTTTGPNSTTTTTTSSSPTTTVPSNPNTTVPPSGGNGQPTPGNTQPQPGTVNGQQILGPNGQPYTQAELNRIFSSKEFKTMTTAPVVEQVNGQPVTSFDKYVQANNTRVAEQIKQATSTPEGKAAWDNMVANPNQFKSMVDYGNVVTNLSQNPDAFAAFSNPNNYPNLVKGIETLHQNYPNFQGPQFDMLVQDVLRLSSMREQLLAQGKTQAEIDEILKSLFGS